LRGNTAGPVNPRRSVGRITATTAPEAGHPSIRVKPWGETWPHVYRPFVPPTKTPFTLVGPLAARPQAAGSPFVRYRERFEAALEPEQRESIARDCAVALGTVEAYALWLAALEAYAPSEDVVAMLREAVARGHTRFTETLRLRYPAYLHEHELSAWASAAQTSAQVLALAEELCARGRIDQAMLRLFALCDRLDGERREPSPRPGWGVDVTLMLLDRNHPHEAARLFARFADTCRSEAEQGEPSRFLLTRELVTVCCALDPLVTQAIASALRLGAPELASSTLATFGEFAEPDEVTAQVDILRARAPHLAELYADCFEGADPFLYRS
jgi:hypothetical protein